MVFEVDGGGLADLLGDVGLGDEAEHGETVVWLLGEIGENGLGAAARLRRGGESVDEALGECVEVLRVPLHC